VEKPSGKSWKRKKSKQPNFLTFSFSTQTTHAKRKAIAIGLFRMRMYVENSVSLMLLYTAAQLED